MPSASWLLLEPPAGAADVLHGQQDIGQALEPERLESMQLVSVFPERRQLD